MGSRSDLIGTCAIPTTNGVTRAACGTPGALTIVGTTRIDAGEPCQGIPFTRSTHRYGDYYLCLGSTEHHQGAP